MAENETSEQPPAGSGKMRGILICAVVGIVAGTAGFAVPYFIKGATGEEEVQPKEAPPSEAVFVAFGETTVNLDEGRLNRYLRVSITLQVDNVDEERITQELETNRAILKSWLLSYLSDKAMDDIRGAAGQNRLRREIQNYFNEVLSQDGNDPVHDVLFEEFNVQ